MEQALSGQQGQMSRWEKEIEIRKVAASQTGGGGGGSGGGWWKGGGWGGGDDAWDERKEVAVAVGGLMLVVRVHSDYDSQWMYICETSHNVCAFCKKN